MSELEILNAPLVSRALDEKGLKRNWVAKQLGLSRSTGYVMFRSGTLPSDETDRKQVLAKLAKITGLSVTQILVRIPGTEDVPA